MKKLLFISAMALMGAGGLQAQNLSDTIYYDEDWKVVHKVSDAAFFRLYDGSDKSEGRKMFKDFYITGEIQSEGCYLFIDPEDDHRSVFDGESTLYHKNGNRKSVYTYSRSVLQGYCAEFDSAGVMREEGNFKDGELDGHCYQYYESGEKSADLFYVDGLLDGKQVHYLGGRVNGEEYFEDGVCKKDISFFFGTDSVMEVFSLIDRQEETFTANKTRYFRKDQDAEVGMVSADYVFDFDPEIWEYPFQFYYLWTCELGAEEPLKTYHGKYQEYDHEGRILKDGQYQDGEKIGEWKYYHYEQNVYQVSGYDRMDTPDHYYTLDGRDFSGEYVSRHPNGKVSMSGNCIDGFKDGVWTVRDSLGHKTVENTFKNGKLHGKTVEYFYWEETDTEPYYIRESNFEGFDLEGLSVSKIFMNGNWETIEFRNFRNGKREGAAQFLNDNGLLVVCNFRNDLLDGDYARYSVDNVEDILSKNYLCHSKGMYRNGDRTGLWTYYNHDDKICWTCDYDNLNSPILYYNLNGKPFTGTLRDNLETDDPDDDSAADTAVIIIKKSLVQRVEYINSKTGKVIAVDVYKKGVKVE